MTSVPDALSANSGVLERGHSASITVAVLSDLHAYESAGESAPSHLRITDPESEPGKHPIAGLRALIAAESLRADLILCPGDLGDKAHLASLQYAWHAVTGLCAD